MRVLILDRPPAPALGKVRQAFERACGANHVDLTTTLAEALDSLKRRPAYDLLVVDYVADGSTAAGLAVLAQIRHARPELPVLVVAEPSDVQTQDAAIREGAIDFLIRSDHLEERVATTLRKVRKVLDLVDETKTLRRQADQAQASQRRRYRIIGQSSQMRAVLALIERVAPVPRPVLITGERGTGKELVARALHEAAATGQKNRPFVAVNCAAVNETLLESELFGHERGAFTGANAQTAGKFEQAHGGTLFLDEIGHMSLAFQKKILRVSEYNSFTRVGGKEEIEIKTRILAATNADLRKKIDQGDFLPDLYDRLAFEVIAVPPLRQRQGDIEVLAEHFLQQFMSEVPSFCGKRLAKDAIEILQRYAFPGNVRELKNLIERAVYRDTTNQLTAEDIGLLDEGIGSPTTGCFKTSTAAFERKLIEEALQRSSGNHAQAARELGLSYAQFRHYHKKHMPSH